MKHLKVVDLFSGCGGLSLGFQQAGFDIVAAFELWEPAIETYKRNFDHPVFRCDLSDVESSSEFIRGFSPDLIIGGPPCQDFSSAGKREEKDRANLTVCFAEIISSVRPLAFVMENVERAKDSRAFAEAERIYRNSGYGLTEVVLNAALCGVPQRRKRFFCIGIKGGKDNQLIEALKRDLSDYEMTLREYFGDSLGFQYYYRHPRNYSRRAVFSIDEPAPTVRGVNRPIPKGYPGHPEDACPIGPDVHALTSRDRSRIQTFPESFIWVGTRTDVEQMIGNAVPVGLARYVALHLMDALEPERISEFNQKLESFSQWLEKDQNIASRARSDVISRLKRAVRIAGPIEDKTERKACYDFDSAAEGRGLTASVRSQIKHAIRLYCQWENSLSDSNLNRS